MKRQETVTGRYLVTGAAGFIGSHLCERLLDMGHSVLGVDRFSPYYPRQLKEANLLECRLHEAFDLHEGDITEVDLPALLSGVDGVFHLAAQPGVRASWGDGFLDYVRDNIFATQRLLDAVTKRPVPVVMASSSSVYGDTTVLPIAEEAASLRPVSPYGLTKLAIEHLARIYVQQLGLHVVCLRYFTVYGPRQRPDMAFTRFLKAAFARETIEVLGDGSQSRDFSFVGDVVDATIRALHGPPGGIYNVGGGEPTSINDVISVVGDLLGSRLNVTRKPQALGDVRHTWADTTKARHELGWTPRTDLRHGLAAQLAWLDEHQLDEDQLDEHQVDEHRLEDSARAGLADVATTVASNS
jgi:UDP-glucose 4-epimerase